MTKHDWNIKIFIDNAMVDIGLIISKLRIERETLSEINNFGDDDYADRVLGYRDRIAEILMDVSELSASKLKGECE